VPVSERCEELSLRPTVFYRWQKELFENGAAAFQSQERPHRQVEETDRVLGEDSELFVGAANLIPPVSTSSLAAGRHDRKNQLDR
jgi:hypothetical protein